MGSGETLVTVILFLVIGAIFISWFYYRSKEKQMIIEKGMDYKQMMEFFKTKRKLSPYILLNFGIIIICFSIGLAIGMAVDEYGGPEAFRVAPGFAMVGIGFVLTFVITKRLQKKEDEEAKR